MLPKGGAGDDSPASDCVVVAQIGVTPSRASSFQSVAKPADNYSGTGSRRWWGDRAGPAEMGHDHSKSLTTARGGADAPSPRGA
jgi:hypothetical protein